MLRVVADFDTGNMLAFIEAGYAYPGALGSTKFVETTGLYWFAESTGIVEHDDGNRSFGWVGPADGIDSAVYDPVDNILALSLGGNLYRMNIKSGQTFELDDLASNGVKVKRED